LNPKNGVLTIPVRKNSKKSAVRSIWFSVSALALVAVRASFFAAILCASGLVALSEANPPLKYEVSWLGNTFGGANDKWVQNFFIHTRVQPDGTVNTWSHWDEGGKKFGVYKDGDVIGNTDINPNSLETRDKAGRIWKIVFEYPEPKFHEYDILPRGITCDGVPVEFPGLYQPMALAMANDGQLLVADSQTGPRQQVLFYDLGDFRKPKLTRAFGDYGGIASGKPGQVAPTKFWGIRGVGMDREGNIYVAMSEMGSCLRKFTPDGKLVWELRGDFFVDVVSPDPTTDALDVWGVQEHYRMDYTQPPGQEAKLVGYSLDRHKYPNDPRGLTHVKQNGEHGLTSPQVVYLNGKRFLFVGGMFASNFINIFRYEDEMAIPSGLILQWGNGLYRTEQKWPPNKPAGKPSIWRDTNGDGDYQANEFEANTSRVKPGPFWVDGKGNIWMAYGFFRYDFQGLDGKGNPIYSADKITVMDPPRGVANIARVIYLDEIDTLIVAEEGEDMRHIGKVFVCKNYLAGNRDTISFRSAAGAEAACVAAAGDYVFTGGWKERGRVSINRMSDGAAVGAFDPGETVGGVKNTGWIDLLTGITACRRKDGEYLVFVEEDYRAKVLLYRWKP
jgi:sugar lactone lactonase YvrE